ncbi:MULTISPECIES: LacI family DNA-binding transcriptional regulator [Metabacillus]|uniref:LacI family transcriptional regulator n=2 Tax=Metabacillus TaxID=2675233 RepID=A0A179T5C7_9BACI|nr:MULTISPECIES: LacI family DNA-binding transcriptional regulator [Metabacillus]OAS88389.1 LacI family transcriptional regulator [Metabacillus litoralis]QNF28120.1 LacI family DNA-binding transcriptional regulator [Metabacillus sp. KUDC1714]
MNQKITIRDVAKHAGVSSATVSYVLNGVNKVSEETKERVLLAIEELNYQPDFTAISLSKRKSKMLGVIMPLVNDSLSPIFKENHYFSELLSGVEYVCRKNGYDFLISGISKPEECKNWVMKRNLDALLVFGRFPLKVYEEMKTLSTPLVFVDSFEEYANFYHNIRIDDEHGGYLGTKHLIELGHKNISFVPNGRVDCNVDGQRFQGYKRALSEANIEFKSSMIIEGKANSFENGYRIGTEIAKNQQMTAIFTSSDITALGIMKSLNDSGKRIPKDISIVGFDDLMISRYSSPSLTTIRQDVFRKGAVSAETAIDAIENKDLQPKQIMLPVELVVRDSTTNI